MNKPKTAKKASPKLVPLMVSVPTHTLCMRIKAVLAAKDQRSHTVEDVVGSALIAYAKKVGA